MYIRVSHHTTHTHTPTHTDTHTHTHGHTHTDTHAKHSRRTYTLVCIALCLQYVCRRQQNRPTPRLSQSQSVILTAQKDESTAGRAETTIRQSTSTPLVGRVRGRGGSEHRLHSHSVEDVKPNKSSVAEEVQPKYQSSIDAWLSVRESEGSGAAWSRSQATLRKTVPALSQGRSDGGDLSNKTPPSHGSWSTGSAARPPAHKTSVVQSSWQLTRSLRDTQSEPNKTAILLKPWQPSHASHVMVHDSDVSDDESI